MKRQFGFPSVTRANLAMALMGALLLSACTQEQ